MESKVVTAVAISVNGHHPAHARRLRHAMEREVLKHYAEHGDILEHHGHVLRSKLTAAHDRELNDIVTGQ